MAIPTCKDDLLSAITSRYQKLDAVLSEIPAGLETARTMDGHAKTTHMSPADLVSYLIGWNELVLKWLARDAAGQAIDFPETGYKWNALGALAQKFYADYDALGFDEKRARLLDAKERITMEISRRSDDELYGAAWHGKWTKGRMIQFNTSSPYENARVRLRSWLKSQDIQ